MLESLSDPELAVSELVDEDDPDALDPLSPPVDEDSSPSPAATSELIFAYSINTTLGKTRAKQVSRGGKGVTLGLTGGFANPTIHYTH